jgi:hypothetical protein
MEDKLVFATSYLYYQYRSLLHNLQVRKNKMVRLTRLKLALIQLYVIRLGNDTITVAIKWRKTMVTLHTPVKEPCV